MSRRVHYLVLLIILIVACAAIHWLANVAAAFDTGWWEATPHLMQPWTGMVLGLMCIPVVFLSLQTKSMKRIVWWVFVPFVIVGGWMEMVEMPFLGPFLTSYMVLWIMCLVAAVFARDQWLVNEDCLCRWCGYNLIGNRSGTCPECSRPVRANPVAIRVKVRRKWTVQLLFWGLGMVPTLIFHALWYWYQYPDLKLWRWR